MQDEEKQLLAFVRKDCLFVFNFHPCNGAESLQVSYPSYPGNSTSNPKSLAAVFLSDDPRFNGQSKTKLGEPHPVQGAGKSRFVRLSLASRSAVVLAPENLVEALQGDEVLQIPEIDQFVQPPKFMGA